MRTILIILLFCSCAKGQALRSGPGSFQQVQDTAYIYLIDGQSNAGSHGGGLQAQFTIDPTKTKHYDTTTNSFIPYSTSGTLVQTGLETQTGGLLAAARNQSTVYLIKVAQGSLAISNWNSTSGYMWNYLKRSIDSSFKIIRGFNLYPKLVSTIWMQGEQDCVVGTPGATYQAALDSLIDRFRRIDPALANAPWVIVKLRDDSAEATYQPGSVAAINAAYVNVAAANANVSLIRPEDIGAVFIAPNDVHYTPASYILIANAWYAQ